MNEIKNESEKIEWRDIGIIKNPTKKQLRKYKGIIYLITNEINQMKYVGKTFNSFSDRYSSGRWWDYSTNNYLNNHVKHYGLENFSVSLIEYNIPEEFIKNKESYYIKEYNCMFPNGYNFIDETEHGKRWCEDAKMRKSISQCKGKIYKIKEVDTGNILEFQSPKQIVQKYGIKEQNLNQLFHKERRTCKGICLPETDPRLFNRHSKIYYVKDETGKVYEVFNISKFAKEHNLSQHSFLCMIRDKQKLCSGFRKLETSLDCQKINRNQKYSKIILTKIDNNVDFTIEIPKTINLFCKENGLYKRDIYALTAKEQKTSKGFRLKEVILLER